MELTNEQEATINSINQKVNELDLLLRAAYDEGMRILITSFPTPQPNKQMIEFKATITEVVGRTN